MQMEAVRVVFAGISATVGILSFLFAVYQWNKRKQLSDNIANFLHGLKAAAEMANADKIVIQINDQLAKLNPPPKNDKSK